VESQTLHYISYQMNTNEDDKLYDETTNKHICTGDDIRSGNDIRGEISLTKSVDQRELISW